jgi:hypothetical protein
MLLSCCCRRECSLARQDAGYGVKSRLTFNELGRFVGASVILEAHRPYDPSIFTASPMLRAAAIFASSKWVIALFLRIGVCRARGR